jgi:2-polyprenyl-3-methyl-5-hydroxy-6-metoxy-1,4-benzoquinol methylase
VDKIRFADGTIRHSVRRQERQPMRSTRRRGTVESLRHAAQYPERARWYLHRLVRDVTLRARHRDHLAYYGAVVDDLVLHGKATAVGDANSGQWRHIGKMQFDYLVEHGLQPTDRVLEIGCGNLRAGWHLIGYLEPGNYYGIDIAQQVLFAAQQTVIERGLTDRLPYLTLVRDMHFELFPDEAFDVVHAHSVFSHAPIEVIDECFAHIGRIMKPEALFDFTFNRTDGTEFGRLREDFYYRPDTLIAAAAGHGLDATLMTDWDRLGHSQSKIRVKRRSAPRRHAL